MRVCILWKVSFITRLFSTYGHILTITSDYLFETRRKSRLIFRNVTSGRPASAPLLFQVVMHEPFEEQKIFTHATIIINEGANVTKTVATQCHDLPPLPSTTTRLIQKKHFQFLWQKQPEVNVSSVQPFYVFITALGASSCSNSVAWSLYVLYGLIIRQFIFH